MTRAQLILRYRRQRTLVTTSASGHLEWLRQCLAPHFSVAAGSDCDWRVTFAADADRYRQLLDLGAHSSAEHIPFFALDSRVVELPRWNGSSSGETIAFDDEFKVFYIVRAGRREVDVLASEIRPWGRVALLRVVRELAMEEAVAAAGIFLHAAAFELAGAVHLVAGPKKAGKTTLLIHALSCPEARYVANDRVLLCRARAGFAVRGMPTLVSVRAGMHRLHARHFEWADWSPDSACLTRSEREGEHRHAGAHDGRIILNPDQFVHALRSTQENGGRLGAILFPSISRELKGFALASLPHEEASARLVSSLFRGGSGQRTSAFGGRASGEADPRLLSSLSMQRVPLLRCALGPDVYDDPAGAHAFARELRKWT